MRLNKAAFAFILAFLPAAAVSAAADSGEGSGFELPFEVEAGAELGVTAGQLSPSLRRVEREDAIALGLSLGASKSFDEWVPGLSASLGSGWTSFLTKAGTDDLIFCDPSGTGTAAAGNCERRYRGWFSDVSASLRYGPVYTIPRANIRISTSLGATIPASRSSRVAGLRTAIRPGLSLGWGYGAFSTGYSLGFSKNWHKYTSVVLDPRDVDIIYRIGGAEEVASNAVAEAGVNTSWSISNSVNMSYSWTSAFSTSASWSFAHAQAYLLYDERDQFTAPDAVVGRVGRQSMTGTVAASYTFKDHFTAGLSMSTTAAPKTSDNRRVRFPFFDTESASRARTNVGVSFAVSY